MHAFGIEGQRFHFGFDTLSGNLLALPRKSHPSGVAYFDHDFTIGANCRVCRRNQGFVRDGLAIRRYGDPGVFGRAYYEIQSGRGLRTWGSRLAVIGVCVCGVRLIGIRR